MYHPPTRHKKIDFKKCYLIVTFFYKETTEEQNYKHHF